MEKLMSKSDSFHKLTLRLPSDVKEWLEKQTIRNASSYASEVVRAVRDRMERAARVTGHGDT
jgi:hypothetical protein